MAHIAAKGARAVRMLSHLSYKEGNAQRLFSHEI